MKKLYICFLLFSTICFSQKKFLQGYYIDNSGKKIECFIKNSDWVYNPTSFEVKNSLEEQSKEILISNATEFSIDGYSKYIRQTIDIDNSKGQPDYSASKEPNFVSYTVFLKVLIEGKNSLYRYENNEFPERFFYKVDNQDIKQLIYKKYFLDDQNDLYANNYYKIQLANAVKCAENNSKVESLTYNEGDLMGYFKEVNGCQGDTNSKEISKRNEAELYYKIALNANFSKFSYEPVSSGIPFDGDNSTEKKVTFSVGFEVELILPFNNKNWAVFTEPTFLSYSGSGIMTSTYHFDPSIGFTNDDFIIDFKYQNISIPLGIKRNFTINNSSKIYLDTAFNTQIAYNSNLTILRKKNNGELLNTDLNGTYLNFFFGLGYQYKKIVAELRQYTNTNLNPFVNSDKYLFKNASFILKYQFN